MLDKFLAALAKTGVEVEPRKVEWLDSTGALLHSITPPKSTGTVDAINLPTSVGG